MKSLTFVKAAVFAAAFSVISTAANATVIYDTTGGAENGGDPLAAAGPVLADRFVTNGAATLSSVTLNLSSTGASTNQFTVDLFTDTGAAGPGAATLIATGSDSSLTSGFQLLTFTPTSTISLAANTAYYIGIADVNGSTAVFGNTVDSTVLSRPSVVTGGYYFNNGGVQANAGGPYEVSVSLAGVPEPSSWALMLVGFGALGAVQRRSRRAAVAAV